MKKKTVFKVVAIALAVVILTTCVVVALSPKSGNIFGTIAELSDTISIDASVASSTYSLSGDVSFESSWALLTGGWPGKDEMNPDLAMFSFLMCLDAQDACRVNIDGASNTNDKDNASFPLSLGFDTVEDLLVGYNESENANDTTRMVVSLSQYSAGRNSKCYFVNVSFSGTSDSSMSEWISNFDIGSTDEALYKTSTEDWTDKNNHKGFDVAATRAIDTLIDYIGAVVPDADESLFNFNFNGYSRGAAVANIVASRFEDSFTSAYSGATVKLACYTFATPATTTLETAGDVPYIYNFIADQDVITNTPPEGMGFRRYGKDFSFTLLGDESLLSAYSQITKTSYKTSELDDLKTALNEICSDRDEYYTVDSADASTSKTYVYTQEEDAVSKYTSLGQMLSMICPDNPEMYYSLSDVTQNSNGKYTITLSVSPAFVGQLLPYSLGAAAASGSTVSVTSYATELLGIPRYQNLIFCVARATLFNSSGIKNMHLPTQYFIYIKSLCE